MANDHFAEDVAKVSRHGKITPLEALIRRQARPFAIHAAALHRAADGQHRVAVAMVRAAIAVFGNSAPEFGHCQDHGIGHAVAEIGDERGDAAGEVVQAQCKLSLRAPLVDVVVPAVRLGKSNLEANIRFDELCDLLERLAVRTTGIFSAASWLVALRVRAFQRANRIERLTSDAVQHGIGGSRVLLFE